jgi:hypothetical protein
MIIIWDYQGIIVIRGELWGKFGVNFGVNLE